MKKIIVFVAFMCAMAALAVQPSVEAPRQAAIETLSPSAMVEALQGSAIVRVAEHRPRREQLVQRQRAMKNIAAEQAELALEIERRQNLPADHACREARRIFIHGRDHEIGDLLAMVVPG